MCPLLTASVVTLNIAACLSLQFVSPPPDRVFELFSSGRSQGQSAQENTIVIQSKPYNVSSSNSSFPDYGTLRRNIHIEREENSEENYTEPKLPQYAIDCGTDKACLEAHGLDSPDPEGTFKPYTQEELENLLAQYAASQGNPPKVEDDSPKNKLASLYMDEEDAVINVLESNPKNKDPEKSKSASWHLIQSQKHNHPYDDQKGWVTLEPVPWAQSQIQKWEPNVKPQIPSWDPPNHHGPTSHWDSRPTSGFSTERPWGKPTYEYKPKPQWSQWTRPQDLPERPSHWSGNPDIVTDDQPGSFPSTQPNQRPWYDQQSYSSNRPTQIYEERPLHGSYHPHHSHHSSHPSEGAGQWVLLSSTKGYSTPPRDRDRGQYQRALTFDTKAPAASMSSHRTVRLTVLPADNSTNTTLSHGGLLEVEDSAQTVEESQREHAAKMLKLKTLKPEEAKPTPSAVRSKNRRFGDELQVFSASPASESRTAVLAAIGAGMIPATMAMLLPMVLGRRKRSADSDERFVNKTHLGSVLNLKNSRSDFSYSRNNEASY